MDVTTVKTNKGKEKLCIDGFNYHLNKKYKDYFYWECEERKERSCKSRMTTTLNDEEIHIVKKPPSDHCLAPRSFKKIIVIGNEILK